MIVLCAKVSHDAFEQWRLVEDTIKYNFTPAMKELWRTGGYEALFDSVPEYFGMTRMYRGQDSYIRFEFTPEQWTVFTLRWL